MEKTVTARLRQINKYDICAWQQRQLCRHLEKFYLYSTLDFFYLNKVCSRKTSHDVYFSSIIHVLMTLNKVQIGLSHTKIVPTAFGNCFCFYIWLRCSTVPYSWISAGRQEKVFILDNKLMTSSHNNLDLFYENETSENNCEKGSFQV